MTNLPGNRNPIDPTDLSNPYLNSSAGTNAALSFTDGTPVEAERYGSDYYVETGTPCPSQFSSVDVGMSFVTNAPRLEMLGYSYSHYRLVMDGQYAFVGNGTQQFGDAEGRILVDWKGVRTTHQYKLIESNIATAGAPWFLGVRVDINSSVTAPATTKPRVCVFGDSTVVGNGSTSAPVPYASGETWPSLVGQQLGWTDVWNLGVGQQVILPTVPAPIACHSILAMLPTQKLFGGIHKQTAALDQMHALEMFAGDGGRHTLDYQPLVGSLEVWEFDPAYEKRLRKNLPQAQIHITDSFRAVESTTNTYDLVVIDCPGGLYGPDQKYCSHFELFAPPLFRIFRDSVVVVVNVSPDARALSSKANSGDAGAGQILKRRGEFYKSDQPEVLSLAEMVETYQRIAGAAGFNLPWHLSRRRTVRSNSHYLAMGLNRN